MNLMTSDCFFLHSSDTTEIVEIEILTHGRTPFRLCAAAAAAAASVMKKKKVEEARSGLGF
ncbi:hypothetical protein HanRHA438_Chr14g0680121 [Helianthus annuus]|nr:hypothetical protein HanRHA438_Chr14g0680121 [Helianthus annuus]